MWNKLNLALAACAFALSGCSGALLTWTPDAAPVYTQPGNNPVASSLAVPVTARDWACKCHCKSCFQ